MTATHEADWRNYPASGKHVEFDVVIFFPWDPQREKFSGERVHVFGLEEALASKDVDA